MKQAIKIKPNIDIDIKNLELIGKGTQGKVYRIDSQKCIKVFKSKRDCNNEVKTLLMSQGDAHFPILYEFGANYIIREYVNGVELNEYLLKSNSPDLYVKWINYSKKKYKKIC